MQQLIAPDQATLDAWLQDDIASRRACEFRIATFAAMRADQAERNALIKVKDAIMSAARARDAVSVIDADIEYEFILAASGDHPILGEKLKARKELFRKAWYHPALAGELVTASTFRIGLTEAVCRQNPTDAGHAINAFFDYLTKGKTIAAIFD
jgi:DNA-binding FadR family transcriptional regulator